MTLFEEVKSKVGSTPVETKPTSEELAFKWVLAAKRKALVALQGEVVQLEESCAHRVRFDTGGLIYDVRSCFLCGASLGLL